MNELHSRTNADLMLVATSKNYGKSTRAAARRILEERGVTVDEAAFANPSAGFIPETPGKGENARVAWKVLSFLIFVVMFAIVKWQYRF